MKLYLQNPNHFHNLPKLSSLKKVAILVLTHCSKFDLLKKTELTIRFVGLKESHLLNFNYRKTDGPTNILSFNHSDPVYLGDLVICVPIVRKEALEQQKKLMDHFIHLEVHGLLHLLGFDHQICTEGEKMEQLEIEIMTKMGLQNPYEN